MQRLVKDTMVPIELFGEPWVLFRDEHGAAACVRDECAHRACPLSLGRVIEGRVQVWPVTDDIALRGNVAFS